jgi:hypothetical protein
VKIHYWPYPRRGDAVAEICVAKPHEYRFGMAPGFGRTRPEGARLA